MVASPNDGAAVRRSNEADTALAACGSAWGRPAEQSSSIDPYHEVGNHHWPPPGYYKPTAVCGYPQHPGPSSSHYPHPSGHGHPPVADYRHYPYPPVMPETSPYSAPPPGYPPPGGHHHCNYPPPGGHSPLGSYPFPHGHPATGPAPPGAPPTGAYLPPGAYPPPPGTYPPPLGYPPPGYPLHPGYPPSGYMALTAVAHPSPQVGMGPRLAEAPRGAAEKRDRGGGGSEGGGRSGCGGGSERPRKRGRTEENGSATEQVFESSLVLEEVLPRLVRFAQEQEGSRFLQQRLEQADSHERDQIFEAVSPMVVKLAEDAFGNFVVQKLFQRVTDDQKKALSQRFFGDVESTSRHKYGCRVIQKALQVLPHDAKLSLARELDGHICRCVEHMHANHVIQKCVENLPNDSGFIIDALAPTAESVATHAFGCRVLQRLLENCPAPRLQALLNRLLNCVPMLARDPHGNYVLQSILENCQIGDVHRVIDAVSSDILWFTLEKVASNVVEKSLEAATTGRHSEFLHDARSRLMGAILGVPGDPNSPLNHMIRDKFGNFIVQRLINCSRGADREVVRQRLVAAEPQLQSCPSGRHILVAMRKAFGNT
eukprot:TRINITY_DN61972_c0_g1_i1.p1 TRINITY_DN61972_c0_g1~~TRINITY_DN61972_c0_g1_i1.p1  ORF type:complete len:598 (-),score=75.76 TRINITY_DN61972_c0_g1_i1:167-1960(-)